MTATQLVADALACLRRERPDAHALFRDALGARTLAITLDREAFAVADGAIAPHDARAPVTITTTSATLDAILNGRIAVIDALLADDLELRGDADDLIRVAAAMNTFLQGAVRCASMPALAHRLAQQARGEPT